MEYYVIKVDTLGYDSLHFYRVVRIFAVLLVISSRV